MATVHLGNLTPARRSLRHNAAVQRAFRAPLASIVHDMGRVCRQLLGLGLFLMGSAMVLTLWLMPLGLPLVLLGLALMTDPSI
jgi:hypothetical protein